ncbi:MAG TPA: GntR family transcriptional regulator [Terracidiphilus sp.]|jgi:DNA-binding transcriptional regulator YhcF (GntR family)|nr:GntR family transcriptional regulator [Terracidiphilus sp.]
MRFWFVHSSEVPLREQIVQQICLGVLSGELAPGERLPSIRELARRFAIHSNTISAAYRELHAQGYVSYRRGSGVYVNPRSGTLKQPRSRDDGRMLDGLLRRAVTVARNMNLPDGELEARLKAAIRPIDRFILVEPDPDLARLVLFEMTRAGVEPPALCSIAIDEYGAKLAGHLAGAIPVVLPSKAAPVLAALGESRAPFVLAINPIAASMTANLPISREYLVAVVSGWPRFLEVGRTMLIAAGFPAEGLVIRDTRTLGWAEGLDQTASIVCDSLTGSNIPPRSFLVVYSLLTEESLQRFRAISDSSQAVSYPG